MLLWDVFEISYYNKPEILYILTKSIPGYCIHIAGIPYCVYINSIQFNLLKNLEWQSTQRQTEKLKLHF